MLLHAPLLRGQELAWAKSADGSGNDASYAVARDNAGNVYIGGNFNGKIDFNPPGNTDTLRVAALADNFIAKYNAAGDLVWVKGLGGSGNDMGVWDIAADATGNVYATGQFVSTVDFNPGGSSPVSLTANAGMDIFLVKYDGNGNCLWAKNFGATGVTATQGLDGGYGVAADGSGNAYVTGFFKATVDFNPGGSTPRNLTATGTTGDIFIAKYAPDGSNLWAIGMGGTGEDYGRAVDIDGSGNVYVTGEFRNTVDFNPDPGQTANFTTSNTNSDIFIARYDASGGYVWAKGIGVVNADIGYDIAVDAAGNAHITGQYQGTVDFNPGGTAMQLVSKASGGTDIFIAKYDATGNCLWANGVDGSGTDIGYGIALDTAGNVFVTGSFSATADFNPGGAPAELTTSGGTNVFVAKYSDSGYYMWAFDIGKNTLNDAGRDIAADSAGNVYVTGTFSSTAVDFDPGVGVTPLSATNLDIFIARYRDTTAAVPCLATQSSLTGTYCREFTFNGTVYTIGGVYKDTLVNAAGCDSIITLNLTILDTVWHTITATACDSFVLNGQTYTSSDTFRQYFTSSASCDSVVILQLEVHSSPQASVTQTGSVLTAGSADSYQWLDCDNGYAPVASATGQMFTPLVSGNYAVAVTADGCSDTSDCIAVEVENDGVSSTGYGDRHIRLYPNPASGRVFLQASTEWNQATVRLRGMTGQLLAEWTDVQGRRMVIDMDGYASGFYLIEISEGSRTARLKLLKE